MVGFLATGLGKDKKGAPNTWGVLISRLVRSYGIFELREARSLSLEITCPFNCLLFKRARFVIDNGGNNYSIHLDDPMEAAALRRVTRRGDDM